MSWHSSAETFTAWRMAERSRRAIYMGAYSPKKGVTKLVPREAFDDLTKETISGCGGGIYFSLPGYASDRAMLTFSLQVARPKSVEGGEGWAVLRRTPGGWRVEHDSYQRHFMTTR